MRSSISVRLSRAWFGFMAIWCLGCSSFDVVIDELLGHDTVRASYGVIVAQQSPSPDDSSGCGCDHCIAVECDATDASMTPHARPQTLQYVSGSALSVAREPQVPPPIAPRAI